MTRPRLLAAALAAAVLGLAAPAGASFEVAAEPRLFPPFSAGVSDYVVRCSSPQDVRLTIRARGEKVAVGDREPRGGEFTVRVRRRPGQAIQVRGGTTHHVRCLPRGFPSWTAERRATPQAQWYVSTPVGPRETHGYVAVFDSRGVPLWWRRSSSYAPWDAKLLPNGHLAWTRYLGHPFGVKQRVAYEERRLDGRLVRLIRAVGTPTDTHELTPLPNGNVYVLAYRPRDGVDLSDLGGPKATRVLDAEIQEVTPAGRVVWAWSSKDHIALSETGERWWRRGPTRHGYDLVHANSVEPDGDGVIVSARHLNAIYRIDKASGEIDWKLGGSSRPESLVVPGHLGDELLFGGQHDARLHGDGTLTLFDNETLDPRPPRALRYRIDPIARVATPLEAIGNPAVSESSAVGSARKLPGGNWVVYWGASPVHTEQTPSGAPVLRLAFDGRVDYRFVPVLPGRLSAAELRRGMSRMVAARRRRG